jgi:hypothetical protein
MKREIIIAGIIILFVGALFLALSQESRIGQTQALTLAYDQQIYSQYGYPCSATAPLQSYTNYEFNVSSVGTISFATITNVNVTDPSGQPINYSYISSELSYIPESVLWYQDPHTYGAFASNAAGNYTFNLFGFAGNPNITLNVFRVVPAEQTYYPFNYMVSIAIGFWVIGLIVALLGVAWNEIFHFPPPPP